MRFLKFAVLSLAIACLVFGGLAFSWLAYKKGTAEAINIISSKLKRDVSARPVQGYVFQFENGVQRPAYSVAPGARVELAITNKRAAQTRIKIVDLHGKTIQDFGAVSVVPQTFSNETPWVSGAGYKSTLTWDVPPETKSGVYFVNGSEDFFVVVRPNERVAPENKKKREPRAAYLVPTNTINAYAVTEKRSLYSHPLAVPTVSFLRPSKSSLRQHWLSLAKWSVINEPLGPVDFLTDADLEDSKALDPYDMLIVGGHSEYWTRNARLNFDAFVDRGGNAVIAGGNIMWWQSRYEADGSLTAYKSEYLLDPVTDKRLVTNFWLDSQLQYPTNKSIGGSFRNGGFGKKRQGAEVSGPGMRIYDSGHPLMAGLGLADCDTIDLGGVTEYDGADVAGLDGLGRPIPASDAQGSSRVQLLAWEWGWRGDSRTIGTTHLFRRAPTSGTVLHMGSKECCGKAWGKSEFPGVAINRKIISKFVELTRRKQEVFSSKPPPAVSVPLSTPFKGSLPVVKGVCGTERAAIGTGKVTERKEDDD